MVGPSLLRNPADSVEMTTDPQSCTYNLFINDEVFGTEKISSHQPDGSIQTTTYSNAPLISASYPGELQITGQPIPTDPSALNGSLSFDGQAYVDVGTTIPAHVTVSWALSPTSNVSELDTVLRAFIPVETVDGPGVITKPLLNGLFVKHPIAALIGAAAASADGQTCDFPPFVETLRFEGDNRGFSFNISKEDFRAESQVRASFDFQQYPNGLIAATPDTGISRSYAENAFDSSGLLTSAAKAETVLNDCSLLHKVGKASPTPIMGTVEKLSDSLVAVKLKANLSNPLVLTSKVVGQIDWDVTLFLDNANNEYTLTGSSTCYPAFELYLNQKLIFGNMPSDNKFPTLLGSLSGILNRVDWTKGPLPLP